MTIHDAARRGFLPVLANLLRKADVNTRDRTGATPLHCAAEAGHLAVAVHLTQHGADVNTRDREGATALLLAARNQRVTMVSHLLDCGADVHMRTGAGLATADEVRRRLPFEASRGRPTTDAETVLVLLARAGAAVPELEPAALPEPAEDTRRMDWLQAQADEWNAAGRSPDRGLLPLALTGPDGEPILDLRRLVDHSMEDDQT
jgi:hypothetical protein